jgi:hypothetical protein
MSAFWRLAFAAHLLATAADARVFHVAVDGSDTGRTGAPFRTLSRAVQAAGPGDTILVHDGTYGPEDSVTGGDSADYASSPVVLRRSGTPSAWITIKAEHKWQAVLDCEMRCDSYINLLNAAYIVIQDFVIRRGYKEGIHSNDAAHHIVLRGNKIEDIANRVSFTPYGMDGMYTNPNCHHFVIDGNVFANIGRVGGTAGLDHGLYLRGDSFTVINNIFHNIHSGWAIQLADGLRNVLIANNTFAFLGRNRNGHIMMWKRQKDVTIRNNIFYWPQGHGITRHDSKVNGPCFIDYNLIVGVNSLMPDSKDCVLRGNRTRDTLEFVNAIKPPYNLRLRPGSAAIGAGLPDPRVPVDFDGRSRQGSRDIGAFRH